LNQLNTIMQGIFDLTELSYSVGLDDGTLEAKLRVIASVLGISIDIDVEVKLDLAEIAKKCWNKALQFFTNLPAEVEKAAEKMYNSAEKAASKGMDDAKIWLDKKLNAGKDAIIKIWKDAKKLAEAAVKAAEQGWKETEKWTNGAAKDIGGAIKDIFGRRLLSEIKDKWDEKQDTRAESANSLSRERRLRKIITGLFDEERLGEQSRVLTRTKKGRAQLRKIAMIAESKIHAVYEQLAEGPARDPTQQAPMSLDDPNVDLAMVDWDAEVAKSVEKANHAATVLGEMGEAHTPVKPQFLIEDPTAAVFLEGMDDASQQKMFARHRQVTEAWHIITEV